MTPSEPGPKTGGGDVSLLSNDAPAAHVTAKASKSKKS